MVNAANPTNIQPKNLKNLLKEKAAGFPLLSCCIQKWSF